MLNKLLLPILFLLASALPAQSPLHVSRFYGESCYWINVTYDWPDGVESLYCTYEVWCDGVHSTIPFTLTKDTDLYQQYIPYHCQMLAISVCNYEVVLQGSPYLDQ